MRIIKDIDLKKLHERLARGWNVGFTGTQEGLTLEQDNAVYDALHSLRAHDNAKQEFHHGDCVGADNSACGLAWDNNYFVVQHPPSNNAKRAFTEFKEQRQAFAYLMRNQHIVEASQVLLACPKQEAEQLRSGTWYTVRAAGRVGIPAVLIFPDGSAELRMP